MTTATVTSKGQFTIPAQVREAMHVNACDRVEFVEVMPGRYEFIASTRSVTELKGMFGKPKKTVFIADMNAAIAARGALLPDDWSGYQRRRPLHHAGLSPAIQSGRNVD